MFLSVEPGQILGPVDVCPLGHFAKSIAADATSVAPPEYIGTGVTPARTHESWASLML